MKLWKAALVVFMLTTPFIGCSNESKRAKAGEAVGDAREDLEESRTTDDANETRAKKAEYDSAKADYEKMNNPSKRDTTEDH